MGVVEANRCSGIEASSLGFSVYSDSAVIAVPGVLGSWFTVSVPSGTIASDSLRSALTLALQWRSIFL